MPVTHSANQSHQVQVDLEIENTLHRLRKEVHVKIIAGARQQTLKELTAPNMENQLLCINIDNNVNFELKSGFIHLLPTFNGLAREDPHGETLTEYWERFELLCIQCPHHQIPDQLLIQYFYEGLMPTDHSIIDAGSGEHW